MADIVQIVQVISAILLMVSILLQHRGSGLGGAFGGSDMSYRSRRGAERVLFRATVLFAAIFVVCTLAPLFI